MLHCYPGIRIGALTVAVFLGLYKRIDSLPATVITKPGEYDWMEKSLDRTDAKLTIEALAPDSKAADDWPG